MYLIGDIGNTEIKLSLLNSKFVEMKSVYLKTQLVNFIYLNKKLKYIKKYFPVLKKILFCSVVPNIFKKIK